MTHHQPAIGQSFEKPAEHGCEVGFLRKVVGAGKGRIERNAGFGGTRTAKPARGINNATVHLDVMIGGPDFEVTGLTAKGKRVPVIADGSWQI